MTYRTPTLSCHDGCAVVHDAYVGSEVDGLRAAVEAATRRAETLATGVPAVDVRGHRIQTVPGKPPTSVHWEPDADPPVVRNLRPVAHLHPHLAAGWTDPRLTGPAADLLDVAEV
ncbi:MAG: hypothetical protein ACRDXB_16025, partial [Actinomycetes bacterium]